MGSKRRRILPWILFGVAVAGGASSLYYGRQLRQFKQERLRLAEEVGVLEISDPRRVHITRIPPGPDDVPPGIEKAHVWRFRMYLPANYGPCFISKRRAVAADSPRSRGGSGSSWSAKQKDPVESQMTVALIKTDNGWMFSRVTGGSSSFGSVDGGLEFDSLDEFVVEPVVTAETPAKSFSANEAICLIRIRGREPIETRDDEPPMYPGLVVYLVESDRRQAFDRWDRGEVDQMPEPQP